MAPVIAAATAPSRARVGAALRGAAWEVLAGTDGAQATGPARDPLGRRGEGLELGLAHGPPEQAPTQHRRTVEHTSIVEAAADVTSTRARS